MERWKKRAVDLIGALSLTDNRDPSVIPYRPSKTATAKEERRTLPRAVPESTGISSSRLISMLAELESERRANIHTILVVRHGKVICEASRPGYSSGLWHLSHSMSKTLTAMAIGLLVDDGILSIEERVADIFPEFKYSDPRFAEVTVEHLLAMRSGVRFSELGVVTESGWTEAFFASELGFAPGEAFAYNSMNSYILGRIAARRADKTLLSLVSERIFAPLGIKQYHWELGPEGIEKGGFGVYLSAESWAKLGLMMLSGGVYGSRRILSQSWVSAMLTTHSQSPESSGDFNYGYHIWVHRERDDFLFNGMLGQNVWVSPSTDTVAVITAGNNELFQQSPALGIVMRYLADNGCENETRGGIMALRAAERRFFGSRVFAHPLARRGGLLSLIGLRSSTPYDTSWDKILGSYSMRANNDSLLPLFVRCMQNNLRGGMDSLELSRDGDLPILTVRSGDDVHRLVIGLYGFSETVLDFNGEKYLVRALGESTYGDDGAPLYRITILFPELPNTRFLELRPIGDGSILLSFTETPGKRIAASFLESMPVTNPKLSFAKQMLERRFGADFLERRLDRLFSPSLTLVAEGSAREAEILAYEEELAAADNAAVTSLMSLASRFLKEDPLPEASSEDSAEESGGALYGVLERIKRLIKRDK